MSILEWIAYHVAGGCIGLSPGIVQGIARRGIDPGRIAMVPNGCDLELFSPEGDSERPEGVAPGDFLAVFTGAHGAANGLGAVLDAAVELKRRGRRTIKIAFIGDGKQKPSLMRRAREESLDNCLFLDPVPKLRLTALMRGADAGLMVLDNVPAFYFGTSPNKFFDYIAMGLPVINNYPGWLAELIDANQCGLAVEPGNPRAFADALEAMADMPEQTRHMGLRARALAEGEFNRSDLGNRFVGFLEEVVRVRRGPARPARSRAEALLPLGSPHVAAEK